MGGKGLFSPPCTETWRGICPPCPTACSTPDHHHHRGLPYDRLRRRFGDAADVAESSVERGLPFDIKTTYSDLRSTGSFGGLNNLRRYTGARTRSAREFLAKRDSYTLHKPKRLRFPRRKTYSKGIADLYQIDLVDVSGLSSHNDGLRYLLTK